MFRGAGKVVNRVGNSLVVYTRLKRTRMVQTGVKVRHAEVPVQVDVSCFVL